MLGGNNVRRAQDRNGLIASRFAAQMQMSTVTARRKRVFGGPLALPATPAAKDTALISSRIFLQSQQVARQLSLANAIAGPGTIK